MNPRTRYQMMMDFKYPDEPFVWVFPIRKGTADAWAAQGYTEDDYSGKSLNYDGFAGIPLITGHHPLFEKKTVEIKDGHITYYDEEGALRIDGVDAQGSGFVTRKWLEFPVKNHDDFIAMKKRYDPYDISRRADNFDDAIKNTHVSEYPIMMIIQGFYWTMRQWMGFEGLSMAFYDMPDLIEEMMDFILDYNIKLMECHLINAKIDNLMINEDMAYKTACMVSPKMLKSIFLPRYKKLVESAKRICADKVFVDSDGHISDLIPFWIEAGVDGTLPVEIASEQDILKYICEYPNFLFIGGIDKRVLSGTKDDVEREVIPKATEMYSRGGCIPIVDHTVPADAKFENYKYMMELLRKSYTV